MEKLIVRLRQDYPKLKFNISSIASWSPSKQQVSYNGISKDINKWSVLHELGHALLDHKSYSSDVDLLRKEAAAWSKAEELAKKYNIVIDQNHIQSCLDTYRDWLHKRSSCPECSSHGVQKFENLYICLNCRNEWRVRTDRFCRPYRLNKTL